jgi:hypothetical protein
MLIFEATIATYGSGIQNARPEFFKTGRAKKNPEFLDADRWPWLNGMRIRLLSETTPDMRHVVKTSPWI